MVVDCGIAGDVSDVTGDEAAGITVRHDKVLRGTSDMRREPALNEAALDMALQAGAAAVRDEATQRGARVVGVGEVGIGNTTSAAALLAALTGSQAAECCGRGTGLDDDGLAHKVATVREACACHASAISKAAEAGEPARAREALRRVGGLELAAMVGAYMEAPSHGVVTIVDGFISAVAALCAVRMQPSCRAVMLFASAFEEEPTAARGGAVLSEALKTRPALSMGLRLGEASGAALALPMVRAAAALVTQMGTLQEALALGPPAAAAEAP